MAKEKKQVERITDMETDFAKWYTDVCTKAELIDYTSTKGMFILHMATPSGRISRRSWMTASRLLDM